MIYDLNDVVRYALEIVNKIEHGEQVLKKVEGVWGEIEEEVQQLFNKVNTKKTKEKNLASYAEALARAAKFLSNLSEKSEGQDKFISTHVNHLEKLLAKVHPDWVIESPKTASKTKTKSKNAESDKKEHKTKGKKKDHSKSESKKWCKI